MSRLKSSLGEKRLVCRIAFGKGFENLGVKAL